jgi:hypothetical protein
MAKLEPMDRIIKAPDRVRVVRCLVCSRPLDQKERLLMVHADCMGSMRPKGQGDGEAGYR